MPVAKRILVVEDEADQRVKLVAAIHALNKGYEVQEAANTFDATKLLDSEHFDLVISDNYMGRPNEGLALREMMWLNRQDSIPFILYTTEEPPGVEEKLKKFGGGWSRSKRRMPPERMAHFASNVLGDRRNNAPRGDSS